jgi:hypothetical protein
VQNEFKNPDLSTFLREMAARALFRSKNCFDLAAANELRLLAYDLEKRQQAWTRLIHPLKPYGPVTGRPRIRGHLFHRQNQRTERS